MSERRGSFEKFLVNNFSSLTTCCYCYKDAEPHGGVGCEVNNSPSYGAVQLLA